MKLSWFKGLSGKLFLLVAVPVVTLFISIGASVHFIGELADNLDRANTVRAPLILYAGEMDAESNDIVGYIWSAMTAENSDDREQSLKELDQAEENFEKAMRSYDKLPQSEDLKVQFEIIKKDWPRTIEKLNLVEAKIKGEPHDRAEIRAHVMTEIIPLLSKMDHNLKEISTARVDIMESESQSDREHTQMVEFWISSVGVVMAISTLAVAFVTARRLVKILDDSVSQLKASSAEVTNGSDLLASASLQVAESSTQSASAIEETVATMEQLTSMVKVGAEHGKQASLLAETSREYALNGEKEIGQLISSMKEVASSSQKIVEVVNVIDDIAFQTNLLALNAAVEAARAGDHGKGFAVVAEAVRALAQKSAASAKEINDMIRLNQQSIEKGVVIADRGGRSLKNIVDSIQKVTELNREVAAASNEQANGITQISTAMTQMDTATQQNAAATEEVSASAQTMQLQSGQLEQVANKLFKLVHGA